MNRLANVLGRLTVGLLALALGLIVGQRLRAAVVDVTAPLNSQVVVNGKTVATVGADGVTLNIKPATRPVDPPDVAFKAPPGMAIKRLTSGIGSLKLQSNTCYLSSQFESGGRAKLTGSGVIVSAGNNTVNVLVKGIDFVSTSATEDCVRVVADGCNGVTFDDCSFQGGRDNFIWQGQHIEGPCTNKNLAFPGCRFIDPLGSIDRSGQNLFVANTDGVQLKWFALINAGFNQKTRTLYAHGFYCVAGNRNVVCEDGIVINPQNIGLHLRGPLKHDYDADDGQDPGPIARRVVFYNAPIAVALNGPRGTVEDCTAFIGPHLNARDNSGGECFLYGSVAKGTVRRNTIQHSPVFQPGTKIGVLRNAPWSRGGLSDAQRLKADIAWQWTRGTGWATPDGKPDPTNVVNLAKVVNLDDLVAGLRGRGDIAAAVAEAKRRAN